MFHPIRKTPAIAGSILATLLLALVPVTSARASTAAIPARVVAIGDVHGEIDGVVEILREADLIDTENRWIAGDTTLVQTGDIVDRGAGVRQVLDLMMSLQSQAAAQGGEVIVLMGNHESINLLADFQDVSAEIFGSFAGEDAEKLRQKSWKEFVRWMNSLARSRGLEAPDLGKEKKEQWMKEHPPGYFEYLQAMGPDGTYGKWLLDLPVMVKIGDTAFMHAGIGPDYADLGVAGINELHRREFATYLANRRELVEKKVIPWFYNLYEINQALSFQAQNPPLDEFFDRSESELISRAAEDLNRLQEILLEGSPLWYRGYTNLPDEDLEVLLDELETGYGVHRFVVAHSPVSTGNIRERLDGRVFLIDTGMLSSVYHGQPSALEIEDGQIAALYRGGERQVLVEGAYDMMPASAASHGSVSASALRVRPAVYRKSAPGRFRLAAYPPEEGDADSGIHQRVWRDPVGNPLPFESAEELEQFLATAEVKSQQNIPKGVTKPKKILLEKNGVQAHAKFNYVDRSSQREKMADGTIEMYFLDSYKSDMAAYRLSQLLGMESVPPGVVRNIDGQDGIVQLWVEGLNTYENWLKEGNTGTPASTYFDRQLRDMYTFDLLIRNTDRNQGNIAWDQDNNLWLIDHTRSLARDKGLREPDKFKGCSRPLFEGLKSLDEAKVTESLSPYLGSFEIKALMKRRDELIKLIDKEIKKQGEAEVLFNYSDPPPGLVISYD